LRGEEVLIAALKETTTLAGGLKAENLVIESLPRAGAPDVRTLVDALRSLKSKGLVSWDGTSHGYVNPRLDE